MGRCPHCQTRIEHGITRCPGCGAFAWRPIRGGADDDLSDEQLPQVVNVTFTLRSGEAVEVRDFLDTPATEQAIRTYGQALAADLGTSKVRTFAYWYDDDFYMDAVLMDEVAAFSVSADWDEEDEEEE